MILFQSMTGVYQVLPLRFVYDRISEKFFTYNPETGETAPTTIDVAKKLERAAVWDDKQIEERIKNHYDGVPCKWMQETFEVTILFSALT